MFIDSFLTTGSEVATMVGLIIVLPYVLYLYNIILIAVEGRMLIVEVKNSVKDFLETAGGKESLKLISPVVKDLGSLKQKLIFLSYQLPKEYVDWIETIESKTRKKNIEETINDVYIFIRDGDDKFKSAKGQIDLLEKELNKIQKTPGEWLAYSVLIFLFFIAITAGLTYWRMHDLSQDISHDESLCMMIKMRNRGSRV